jgi:hypothetical protein
VSDLSIDVLPKLPTVILVIVINRFFVAELRVGVKVIIINLLDGEELDLLGPLLVILLPHHELNCIRPQLIYLVVEVKLVSLESPILEDQSAIKREIQCLSLNHFLLLRVFVIDIPP